MGAKHIKTQARKLNKYILYILIGLVLLMAIFAIPKTSLKYLHGKLLGIVGISDILLEIIQLWIMTHKLQWEWQF